MTSVIKTSSTCIFHSNQSLFPKQDHINQLKCSISFLLVSCALFQLDNSVVLSVLVYIYMYMYTSIEEITKNFIFQIVLFLVLIKDIQVKRSSLNSITKISWILTKRHRIIGSPTSKIWLANLHPTSILRSWEGGYSCLVSIMHIKRIYSTTWLRCIRPMNFPSELWIKERAEINKLIWAGPKFMLQVAHILRQGSCKTRYKISGRFWWIIESTTNPSWNWIHGTSINLM